ncbi:response regulator [Paraburkholderia sp. 22B1P]|uniref:response regulator transcription factor n=1 Tax=Paraburkholderia sp. 22B1P TaxID=3080498 RepID=UPI003086B911|nr:response regulator [Paraburkholderia sp. 22B1P]
MVRDESLELKNCDEAVVYIIDDDPSVRFALSNLLRSAGFRVFAFEGTEEFSRSSRPDIASCLLLDVRLRGESGLSFQREVRKQPFHVPIIFLTAHGDIEMSVQAMKEGAIDFLVKPAKDQRVIEAVVTALSTDADLREAHRNRLELRARYDLLTPREREVIHRVADGMLNKQIAAALNLSEITIKMHRSSAMRKMETTSVADLVRKIERLGGVSELRVA